MESNIEGKTMIGRTRTTAVILVTETLLMAPAIAGPVPNGYAWGENIGWVHLSVGGNESAQAEQDYLTGFFWSEAAGWIHLGSGPEDGYHYGNDS